MINKSKLIFIYSVVLIYLISIGLTHINENFIFLTLIIMGFILGFMANETFFKEDRNKHPITEGNTLSNIRTNCDRKMPSGPPPSLSKKEEEISEKETIRVSFAFDIDVGSDLDQELEFLDSKKMISRIREKVADHIKEKIQNEPNFLKYIKVDFPYNLKTREQIIDSMCFNYRHDYGLVKKSGSISGMTGEERISLVNKMSQIFDNSIAPYVELKCIGKAPVTKSPTIE